ncbi:MAG TPA: hypothetical protein VEV41_28115 [Terriglobales bacterium]|nr:hypothetical protein [Terriglobales bacterium]
MGSDEFAVEENPGQVVPVEFAEDLRTAAAQSTLTEDLALALLKRPDLSPDALEALSKNANVIKLRKVRRALVEHPRTPRHISLPMLRHLYAFDLMQVALTPVVPADLKRAADEALVTRLETLSSGEKLSLAYRASGRIAEELLLEKEPRVMRTALENPRLTESSVVKALVRHDPPVHLVEAVCHHAKWSLRREVRVALLRNEKTPVAKALEFARSLPPGLLREILQSSRLPAATKAFLLKELRQPAN